MRLYDLTHARVRMIASKKFRPAADARGGFAHKIADEIVLQFTGEPAAPTPSSRTSPAPGHQEITNRGLSTARARPVTRNGSLNSCPSGVPNTRSLAFTSYKAGIPISTGPSVRAPAGTALAVFSGINSSPAFQSRWAQHRDDAVEGRQPRRSSRSRWPPGAFRRSLGTRHRHRPSWLPRVGTSPSCPTGSAPPRLVMDAEGRQRSGRSRSPASNSAAVVTQGRHHRVHDDAAGDPDLGRSTADGSNARRSPAEPATPGFDVGP